METVRMEQSVEKDATGMDCSECGMRVTPATAFHPYLYCWLRKHGITDPGAWLDVQGFGPKDTRVNPPEVDQS